MITFILNGTLVRTESHPGKSLLDIIRYELNQYGTKTGCREGDCGACTVLEGSNHNNIVEYKSILSCLTPLGNVAGKHIVTIEGLNMDELTPVQKSIVDHAGTQCGFCTPGFVLSLTGYCMQPEPPDFNKAIAAISGNLCRCTGYKSIEKAAEDLTQLIKDKDINDPVSWLVKEKFLPEYFNMIPGRLSEIQSEKEVYPVNGKVVGGGTDLMVKESEEISESDLQFFSNRSDLKRIVSDDDHCVIGAASTAADIMNSSEIQKQIPDIRDFFKLISSEQVRNMGTIGGNIMNASPIGDLSIIFLALNAELTVANSEKDRVIPLRDFFSGYKKLNITRDEYVKYISFQLLKNGSLFNFEKVSKRKYLDIASVNSAIRLVMKDELIADCCLSAGGVSPVPLYLKNTSAFITGKKITCEIILEANTIMQSEISPISDIRGTKEYKRLLLRQLLFAHFIKMFPDKISLKKLSGEKY
jgi:xanthine dehydrogenase small subunit